MKVEPIFAALSGRIGVRMPDSRSTLNSNVASEIDCRALDARELRLPIGPGSLLLFVLYRCDCYAGDSLATTDPPHPLVGGRLDGNPGRGRVSNRALHLGLVGGQAR